jgi:hypothetical protein
MNGHTCVPVLYRPADRSFPIWLRARQQETLARPIVGSLRTRQRCFQSRRRDCPEQCFLGLTCSSRAMFAGPVSSSKNRHRARRSKSLIRILALASLDTSADLPCRGGLSAAMQQPSACPTNLGLLESPWLGVSASAGRMANSIMPAEPAAVKRARRHLPKHRIIRLCSVLGEAVWQQLDLGNLPERVVRFRRTARLPGWRWRNTTAGPRRRPRW